MLSRRTHIVALTKATVAVAVWGASFIATKIALQEISPVTVIWLRFGIGVVVLGVIVALRKEFTLPSKRELAYFSLIGIQGITFHQWLQVTGLQTSKATTTAWIITTIPIFIAVLAWAILKERLGGSRVVGILIAAVGVLLVIGEGDVQLVLSGRFGAPGDLLVFLSAPNWAVFSVLSRQGLRKHPATQMMFYVMLLGWLFTTIWLMMSGKLSEIALLSMNGWWSIFFLGVLCSGIAYIFWYDALREVSASQVGSLLYLEPLVAVVVAFFLLGEPLFLAAFLGGALILLGVWLVNRRHPSEGPPD